MMRNRRGAVETMVVAIIYGMALIGSAISLSPPVRASFQESRALEICEFSGETAANCEVLVGSWSKKEILAYIKDDGSNDAFYARKKVEKKSGGRLLARARAAQK